MCVARWRTVALLRGARRRGVAPSKPSSTLILANSGMIASTGVFGSSLPRSIRIIAAVEPTAFVIEKIRKTVSCVAFCPGARSPDEPDHLTPSLSPTMATRNGASCARTLCSITSFNSDIRHSLNSHSFHRRLLCLFHAALVLRSLQYRTIDECFTKLQQQSSFTEAEAHVLKPAL